MTETESTKNTFLWLWLSFGLTSVKSPIIYPFQMCFIFWVSYPSGTDLHDQFAKAKLYRRKRNIPVSPRTGWSRWLEWWFSSTPPIRFLERADSGRLTPSKDGDESLSCSPPQGFLTINNVQQFVLIPPMCNYFNLFYLFILSRLCLFTF